MAHVPLCSRTGIRRYGDGAADLDSDGAVGKRTRAVQLLLTEASIGRTTRVRQVYSQTTTGVGEQGWCARKPKQLFVPNVARPYR